MRLQPLLAKAAAYSLEHSLLSTGAMGLSLLYFLIPFAVLHHQFPFLQLIGDPYKIPFRLIQLPLTTGLLLKLSPCTQERELLSRGSFSGGSSKKTQWYRVPLVGSILAIAFNSCLLFVAAHHSLV